MGKVLIPKRWISTADIVNETISHPLFFLGGPVRGGGDWQARMFEALQKIKRIEHCIVAVPTRWNSRHPLRKRFLEGAEHFFARQLSWERHYLELAGTHPHIRGCIIFWLCCESKKYPHPGPEPYAMDTRGELGEWRWRMKTENARVVVGAEAGFLGLSQIQRNFSEAVGYDFPIHKTIEETARAAAALAYRH